MTGAATSDVTILLLAAGRSTRMRGPDKLLENIDGRPLLSLMADRCCRAARTRVVIGQDQPQRREALSGLDVEIIEIPSDSMASSIRAGVIGLQSQGAMIVLADMPELEADDFLRIINAFEDNPRLIHRGKTHEGRPGHPVLFPQAFFADLGKLSGDVGAQSILKSHRDLVQEIDLPGNRALIDLDTPEDWAAWRASQPKK